MMAVINLITNVIRNHFMSMFNPITHQTLLSRFQNQYLIVSLLTPVTKLYLMKRQNVTMRFLGNMGILKNFFRTT